MSHEERNAIEDCGQLFDLTVDYLETITLELKKADSLTDGLIGKIETLLSGVMTNQDTCYDGLVDSRSTLAAALKEPITNATLLYSVSLGLVTRAIGRDRKRGPRMGNVWGEGFPTNITLSKLKKVRNLLLWLLLVYMHVIRMLVLNFIVHFIVNNIFYLPKTECLGNIFNIHSK